jgi:hypothetical protein
LKNKTDAKYEKAKLHLTTYETKYRIQNDELLKEVEFLKNLIQV